jgi:hypothetical protein
MSFLFDRLRRRSNRQTVRLLVHCFEDDSCWVAFEPWGAVETLKADDKFEVELAGPGDGVVEIAYHAGGISIWAWSGADVTARDKAGNRLRI